MSTHTLTYIHIYACISTHIYTQVQTHAHRNVQMREPWEIAAAYTNDSQNHQKIPNYNQIVEHIKIQF